MSRGGWRPVPAEVRFKRQTRAAAEGCLLWTGYIDRDGYGQFRPGGRETTKRQAHRWAYEYFVGPIPAGLVLDHLCRNRSCVNPDHLEPVTNRVNVLRGLGGPSLNARKKWCIRGHEFTAENTYVSKSGSRSCRACSRARDAARYRRHKEALP